MEKAERVRRSYLARWGIRTMEERFWEKVDKSGDCWLWTGAKTPNGYGRFKAARSANPRYTHRMSWTMAHDNAEVPPGMDVCHRCDVRLCVRPDHLWLGTRGDNLRDMIAKGRHRSGANFAPQPPWQPKPPKTSCINGHPYPEFRDKAGRCRECKRLVDRSRYIRGLLGGPPSRV